MSLQKENYLDSNACAPLTKPVVEALSWLLQEFNNSNSSSIHAHGREAKRLISDSKEWIASSLGDDVDTEELLFSSSGSEANQTAIRSVLDHCAYRRWITTPVEHDSVKQLIDVYRKQGFEIDIVKVDQNGCVELDHLQALLERPVDLLSVVWANNETGVINPVPEIAELLNGMKDRPRFHVDGAQMWGKAHLHPKRHSTIDFLTLSGHKIGALSGVAVTWVRPGNKIHPLIFGKQEKSRRGGTENLMGIYAMGIASKTLNPELYERMLAPMRNRLESDLKDLIKPMWINGESARRIANTTNITIPGADAESMVLSLDLEGWSVSTGSACSSGVIEPSHVIKALGHSDKDAKSTLRISLHPGTTTEALENFAQSLSHIVKRVRKQKSPDFESQV